MEDFDLIEMEDFDLGETLNVYMAGEEDCSFDQPCIFGYRVNGHAVYCHNKHWKDGPRKCRRKWYTGGETKDEDCEGFKENPYYKK